MSGGEPQEKYLELLARSGDAEAHSAGDVVFAEGDLGDRMYVVRSGTVAFVKNGQDLETVGPAAICGGTALIDREPRSASAVARSDCELVSIDKRRFWFLVQETPYFAQLVMRVMADRLRRRTE